ncbi:MAG: DUF4418 family protein [Clostridiales bacterium]|nr:DUF4418 family protein [Clostridiales bacterium]
MKNRLITGIVFIILGGFITFGPQTVFPVCGVHTKAQASGEMHMDNCEAPAAAMTEAMSGVMKCQPTARVEFGIGILIVLVGALLIIFPSKQVRLGLNLSLTLNGVLALLIPTVIIGVCNGAQMVCRLLALPALTVFSILVIIIAAANSIYLYKSGRREQAAP